MLAVAEATYRLIFPHIDAVLILKFLESLQVFQLRHILRDVQKAAPVVRIREFISKRRVLRQVILRKYYLVVLDGIPRLFILQFEVKLRLCNQMNTRPCTISDTNLFIFFLLYHLGQPFYLLN